MKRSAIHTLRRSKPALAAFAAAVLALPLAAFADGDGLGEQKKPRGAGLSHQSKTLGKYGAKYQRGANREDRGIRKAVDVATNPRNASRVQRGKAPKGKARNTGRRDIQRGQRAKASALKKGGARAQKRPKVAKAPRSPLKRPGVKQVGPNRYKIGKTKANQLRAAGRAKGNAKMRKGKALERRGEKQMARGAKKQGRGELFRDMPKEQKGKSQLARGKATKERGLRTYQEGRRIKRETDGRKNKSITGSAESVKRRLDAAE